jgi:glutaredoxin
MLCDLKIKTQSNLIALLILFLCSVFAECAFSEVFRWTDENGKAHFSDRDPGDQKTESVEVRVNVYKSVSYDTSIFDTGREVVMYSASWCPYCKKAKRYFEANAIPFTEYDIEKDAAAKSRYERMGAAGVPVILVGKKRMNGFSEAGFRRIYQ